MLPLNIQVKYPVSSKTFFGEIYTEMRETMGEAYNEMTLLVGTLL
jgi:hypothetical protein